MRLPMNLLEGPENVAALHLGERQAGLELLSRQGRAAEPLVMLEEIPGDEVAFH